MNFLKKLLALQDEKHLNNSILKQYNVKFSYSLRFGRTMSSTNDWLSLYISDHDSKVMVDGLLQEINLVLNGDCDEGGTYTQGLICSVIKSDATNIYWNMDEYAENPEIDPSYRLPTNDLKRIAEAWRTYLRWPFT